MPQRAQSIADTLRQLRAAMTSSSGSLVHECEKHITWLQAIADAGWKAELRSQKRALEVEQLLDAVLYAGYLAKSVAAKASLKVAIRIVSPTQAFAQQLLHHLESGGNV